MVDYQFSMVEKMATDKAIFEAADAITAEGGNPTLAAVRARVGGGSYTGITAAMQRWRAARAADQPQEAPTVPIPPGLAQHMRMWWEGALKLANDALQAERDAMAVERREFERHRAEAAELADQLADELDEARAQNLRLEGATARLEVAKAENARQADELVAARVRADVAEARLQDQAERLDRAEQEAEKARREAERARIGEQAAQARLESAARELDELKGRGAGKRKATG